MHRSFFAVKDTFINSGSDLINGTTFTDKNVGQDEILELKKTFDNKELRGVTRTLIQFNTDEIKNYITASNVPNNYKIFLRLYEASGTSGLSDEYTIAANPLTESWDEGVGKEADDPKTTEGCSWEFRRNSQNFKEIRWDNQFPEGESVTGAVATASIDLTHFQSGSTDAKYFFIKNNSPTAPEIREFVFEFDNFPGFINQNFDVRYLGNGLYRASMSGSLDAQGSNLRDTINLFQLNGNQGFAGTLEKTSERTIVSRHHNTLQFDGGAIIPYSASWSSPFLHLSASRGGVTYNNVIISTGSFIRTGTQSGFYHTASQTPFGGGFGTIIFGIGGNYARTPQASQNFSLSSPDIEMDVTNVANEWLSGRKPNYGFLLRLSGSSDYKGSDYETDSGSFQDLKFFSRQTNTIYSPKLELRWDDHLPATGSNTGSLTPLDLSGQAENYVYQLHNREAYKETETVKFRFGARKRYIDKSFSTSIQTVSGSYFPEGSASYSVIDMATNENVIPFSPYTTMSCDPISPYFTQDLNTFEPNRAYKILLKVKHNDGQIIVYDDDFEFILRS